MVSHLLRYFLNEEEAFWVLCSIIESKLPLDYYSSLIGVLVDQKVFERLLKDNKPHLHSYLNSIGIDISLVSLQWFICLFSYNLQPDISDCIWDIFFVKGSKAIFKAGISLFSLFEKNLMKAKSFSNF